MREERNMMIRNVCLMLLATALMLVTVGSARAGDQFNRPGPYMGLGAAGGLSQFGGALGGFGDSAGFDVRGGYRVNDYFALEGLYEYMDDFGTSTNSSDRRFNASAKIQTNNFSLLGKVILPTLGISELQPFVSGGIGFLNANGTGKLTIRGENLKRTPSDTEFAGRVDGGVDLFLTPKISTFFDLGYVMPTSTLSNLTYLSLSLGVKYNF